jgi:hypothetical protein
MLAQAAGGDTAVLASLSGAGGAGDPSLATGRAGLFRGVVCTDFGRQSDYAPLAPLGEVVATGAPRFGAWKFWETVGLCVGWPGQAANEPRRLNVGPSPNVMVVSNTHDPATPLLGALAVWAQIPDARLLTADADGHQALAFSRCAFDAMLRFLGDPSSASRFTACAS